MKITKSQQGFSLIEIMIVVVIVSILAAIAIPSYQRYVLRGYRADATAMLSDAAARQERFFSQNGSYVTDTDDLDQLGVEVDSANNRYQLSVSAVEGGADGGYTLSAAPQGAQRADTDCGTLSLTATGTRGASGSDGVGCWR